MKENCFQPESKWCCCRCLRKLGSFTNYAQHYLSTKVDSRIGLLILSYCTTHLYLPPTPLHIAFPALIHQKLALHFNQNSLYLTMTYFCCWLQTIVHHRCLTTSGGVGGGGGRQDIFALVVGKKPLTGHAGTCSCPFNDLLTAGWRLRLLKAKMAAHRVPKKFSARIWRALLQSRPVNQNPT